MTGLEKVQEQILDEAKNLAEGKIKSAQADANDILGAAKNEAQIIQKEIAAKSADEIKKYHEKIESSAQMLRRTKILEAKQEVIEELLNKALVKIENLEEKEYFEFLLKVLKNNLKAQEGTLFFNASDLQKMPESFALKAKELAKEKGGSLEISKEAKAIKNGFILTYGTIEENCTIEALFNDKKDDLKDGLHKLLFL